MYASSTTIAIAMLSALVSASPSVKPRDSSATVNIFNADTCTGTPDGQSFSVDGTGAYRCVDVTNVRSIIVSGEGCTTTTWSGNDCSGDSFVVPDSACHSVLYASVSVQC